MQWEKKLKTVFDAIDADLEAEYGSEYNLHPSRPEQGSTSNPETDGLFNVGAAFSAGFGSKYGPGYVVEIRMSTLTQVPSTVREEIQQKVLQQLKEELPKTFPGKELNASEENDVIRIHGDLNLE
jgi:hypothetical protein